EAGVLRVGDEKIPPSSTERGINKGDETRKKIERKKGQQGKGEERRKMRGETLGQLSLSTQGRR
ncbi:unnamed protein product, partial [Musa banksii]